MGNTDVYISSSRGLKVKKGDTVKRGQRLTDGAIDPRRLLELTNIDTVQRYMSDELHKVYESQGIKKRNIEVVIKAVTNLGKVEDPGDSDEFIRGDFASLSHVSAVNKKNRYKNPIVVSPILRGMETLPLDQSTDWVARLQYRKLKETFIRAANEGWESDIHGLHPAPGILYSAEFGKGKEGPY
jgi:DNA-directed RNA polymerase subunit beta'